MSKWEENLEPKRRPLVDTKIFDLAYDFLSEVEGFTDDDVWELAGDLRIACEDALRTIEDRTRAGKRP